MKKKKINKNTNYFQLKGREDTKKDREEGCVRVKTLTTVELGQTPLSITTLQVTKKTVTLLNSLLLCMNIKQPNN